MQRTPVYVPAEPGLFGMCIYQSDAWWRPIVAWRIEPDPEGDDDALPVMPSGYDDGCLMILIRVRIDEKLAFSCVFSRGGDLTGCLYDSVERAREVIKEFGQ